jgi:two-component system chemotaxis sensor kinase CheA
VQKTAGKKKMSSTKFSDLVETAATAFGINGAFDQEATVQVLNGLHEVLADGETMDSVVVHVIWQAAKTLQGGLSADADLQPAILAGVHEQLVAASTLLNPAGKELSVGLNPVETITYVIPADDIPLIEDFIAESAEHIDAAEAAMLTLESNLEDSDTLNLIFRSFHTIKGMAGFMNLEQIGLLTHDAENLLDMARKGELLLSGDNADAVFQSIDMLKTMVNSLRSAIAGDCALSAQAGVSELIEYLKNCADGSSGTVTAPVAEAVPSPGRKDAAFADEKIKVSTSRLDSLVDMVGELVIAQLMVAESLRTTNATDYDLLRNTAHQEKIIRELQELSMSMRMVPISGIFKKMVRMTRDLSKKAGKEIELIMEGEQTELDRTIVDKLADPLIHMIRNSVDHGIESPEKRAAAGKPPAGRIQLRAYHAAGSIVIEISDDGKGLNREKLLEKAISRGAIAPDKKTTEQELFSMIFLPGLSTAEEVTSISGRGVGMDVVRRNIEELRGRIDIASTPGKGTVFTITLPLTLAIIDGQIVRVGKEKYIIPINGIRRSFRPEAGQISTIQGRREVVLVRDELLPLVRLHALFEIEPDSTVPSEGLVVIVEEDNEACCLLVDDLLDQQQVVIKNLGSIMNATAGVSGGAIMGDGQVRLILDIPGVIKLFRN